MQLPLHNSNRTMQLLNKTCLKGVPPLYGQDGKGDQAIAYVKFFANSFTWFLTELDQETGEAFGKTYSSHCPEGELGYFSVLELAALRVPPFGTGVERDRHFKPTPLAECRNPCG